MKLKFTFLDNFKIRNKLLILYLMCVFVPIAILTGTFYISMLNSLKEKQIENVNASVSRIKNSLSENIQIAKDISDRILLDSTFNDLLQKDYKTNTVDKFTDRQVLDNIIMLYKTVNISIDSINTFTTNRNFFIGGEIQLIDHEIINQKWYKDFKSGNKTIMLEPYIENGNCLIGLIRYIDIYNTNSEDILRISFNNRIFEKLLQEEFDLADPKEIYFVDPGGRIIASNRIAFNYYNSKSFSKLVNVPDKGNSIETKSVFSSNSILSGWSIITRIPPESYLAELQKLKNFFIFLFFICLVATSLIISIISYSITHRMKLLANKMKKSKNNKLEPIDIPVTKDEIGQTIEQFNRMILRIQSLISEVYEASIQKNNMLLEKTTAELNALQSQINPHFLYNVLNVINAKCMIRSEFETAKRIRSLSGIFRRITTWGNDMITVEEEIEFIEEYLSIQQYRFEEKLEYFIEVEDETSNLLIPKMFLQPLVENACIHGIEKLTDGGIIKVSIFLAEQWLNIHVMDNGPGINPEKVQEIMKNLESSSYLGKRVGLNNVYKRLQIYFGQEMDFLIESVEVGEYCPDLRSGTTMKIRIPLNLLEKEGL